MNKVNIVQIIKYLDKYIEDSGKPYLYAPEANQLLAAKGLLEDRHDRLGMPLRRLLRKGKIPYAYQNGVTWIIPHSSKNISNPVPEGTSKLKKTSEIIANSTRESYKPEKN